jgi:hypothetical protein
MKTTVMNLSALALTLSLLAMADPAAAAPIKECGNAKFGASGPQFTFREISGAGIYNITTRVASCREARRVINGWWSRDGVLPAPIRGFQCRHLDQAYEYVDVRCTGSRGRVVRWQAGA